MSIAIYLVIVVAVAIGSFQFSELQITNLEHWSSEHERESQRGRPVFGYIPHTIGWWFPSIPFASPPEKASWMGPKTLERATFVPDEQYLSDWWAIVGENIHGKDLCDDNETAADGLCYVYKSHGRWQQQQWVLKPWSRGGSAPRWWWRCITVFSFVWKLNRPAGIFTILSPIKLAPFRLLKEKNGRLPKD